MTFARETITPEIVRELLDYGPETGAMLWKRMGLRHCKMSAAAR